MPAPPLAAKGSAGKGEDLPHLLVFGLTRVALPETGASALPTRESRIAFPE